MPSTASAPGSRVALVAAGVALALGAIFVSGYELLAVSIGVCSGDGGSPYSAPASAAGRFCEGPLVTVWALVGAVPTAAILVATVLAVRSRRWRPLAIGVAAAAGAIVLLAVPLALPDR